MKNTLTTIFFVAAIAFSLRAQITPSIEWEKSFGGSLDDEAYSIQQTTDNGYIVVGYSNSNDGNVSGNHGNYDYWVVKLDSNGNIVWQKTFGGSVHDFPYCIRQTTDGGFVVAGHAASTDGDVTGNHGSFDDWITKLDSDGNLVWQKSFGGTDAETAFSVQQIVGGGYIVVGSSRSSDGDVTVNKGLQDYWIIKLDPDGNLVWQKSFGGSDEDRASSVLQTTDGGFVIVGYTWSNDGDVGLTHGEFDEWILKLDSNGTFVWQKALGGSGGEEAKYIKEVSGGGFIVVGYSSSNDGDVSGNHGVVDLWIVKLDPNGNLDWQKCLGGTGDDRANFIDPTSDGNFIVAGYSYSNDEDVSGNHGDADYWILKIDSNGNLVWQESLGGSGTDAAYSVQQTNMDEYIVAGYSNSTNDDVSGNHGSNDYWIVKLSSDATGIAPISSNFISVSPNPVQTQLNIDLEKSTNEVSIHIYDLHGRMFELQTTFSNTRAQLNVAHLPSGFYTLEITNRKTGEREMCKFVKQ